MSAFQSEDIDWESFMVHDLDETSCYHHSQDIWQYDHWAYESSSLDAWPSSQCSSSPSALEYNPDSIGPASPDDGLDIPLSPALEDLEGCLELNLSYEDTQMIPSEGLRSPEVSELIERPLVDGVTHHHYLPHQNSYLAPTPAKESIAKSDTSSPTHPDDHKISSPKRKQGGRRKARGKAPQLPQVIEKRYRSNLNDKIAELKHIVPTLRARVEGVQSGEEFLLAGLEPARTLKKSVVLAKTIEYIKHLEDCNEALASQIVL